MLYSFLWVILRRPNIMFRRFGTLCSKFTGGVRTKNNRENFYVYKYTSNIVPVILPVYITCEDGTDRVFRNVGI